MIISRLFYSYKFYLSRPGTQPTQRQPQLVRTALRNHSDYSAICRKSAHNGYRIGFSMTIDDCILYRWPHILSTDCKKFRSKSFFIFNRLFSYLYFCKVLAGLRPRCFGIGSSFDQLWSVYLQIPYSRLSPRWLFPLRSPAVASRYPFWILFRSFLFGHNNTP